MSVFPKYERYKDSGVDWLGEIPHHWEVSRSKWLFSQRKERCRRDDEQLTASQKYGVIPQSKFVDLEGRRVVTVMLNPELLKRIYKGDFVISMRTFQGGIEMSEYDGAVSSAYVPLEPGSKIHAGYFKYLFKTKHYIKALGNTSNLIRDGQALRFENFSMVDLPVVPIDEQRKIAAFLDQRTAEIDALIAKKQRQIELLNEQKAILIHRAVTRSLKPNAKLKPSGIEWIGDIPEHWETRRARHIFRQEERPIRKTDDVVTAFRDGQVTLRSKRRTEGFTFAILEQGYQGIEPGDLVIHGMDAFAGAIGISEDRGKCTPEYIILNPIIEGIDNGFFALHLREMAQSGYIHLICPSVRERAPRFRFPKLADVLLTIPPLDEQLEIVSLVRKIREESARVVASLTAQIGGFKNLRSTLIAHAVTGRIKVL